MTSRTGCSVVALALLMSAIGASGTAGGASPRTVVLEDIAFSPRKLTVPKGATVTFAWRDGMTPHNVRSRGRLRFAGTGERTRGTHKVRFRKSGSYAYVCTLHPGAMSGRIVVR